MNKIALNKKIIGVVLSITLIANVHESLPLNSVVASCTHFAGKSLAAAAIIGIVSWPFFIKNKDKNSKTLKKQSVIKLLQIAIFGGIGNTALSHLSGKKNSSLEENKGIELQSLPTKVDPYTKTTSSSHPWLGTAIFTGFGSLCSVVFSRLSSPFKKSKKPNLETRINMIEKKIQEKNAVYRETSMHVLDAFVAHMAKQLTGNEAKTSGINIEEFSIRLARLTETFEEFKPTFNKIVENFCTSINRSSSEDTQKLASQLTAFGLKLSALETDVIPRLMTKIEQIRGES